MPRFTPFRAYRYAADVLDDLVAPPYDVLSEEDLDELGARSAHNITHVDVPREADGPDRYERAGAMLATWVRDGTIVADERPTFTLYRMRFTDASGARRDIVGVIGGLEVVDEGAGGVLPHERVTPKASTDRLDLTRATGMNLSPIWGLSLAQGLSELLAEPGDPARVAAIAGKVASDDVLIADGHHRYGVSRHYRDEVRAARGGDAGDAEDAEDTMTMVSELVADQLSVEAIHRLYGDVGERELVAALERCFELEPAHDPDAATLAEMDRRGALCLVQSDGSARWLMPRPGAFDDVRSLDGAWLEHALADVDHTVRYQHGVEHVVRAVASGEAVAAVLIRPVSVEEIERTAREGLLMPPKSTFFTPKLRTGFVLRSVTE